MNRTYDSDAEIDQGPRYHVTAERNWMNDPNGPIHHEGRWHLFFQANPEGPEWGPPSWGHVSSTDLARWERHPDRKSVV